MCLRKIFVIILMSTVGVLFIAGNSWALPNCSTSGYKHNCFGISLLPNGDKYKGEWKEWNTFGTCWPFWTFRAFGSFGTFGPSRFVRPLGSLGSCER